MEWIVKSVARKLSLPVCCKLPRFGQRYHSIVLRSLCADCVPFDLPLDLLATAGRDRNEPLMTCGVYVPIPPLTAFESELLITLAPSSPLESCCQLILELHKLISSLTKPVHAPPDQGMRTLGDNLWMLS